MQRSTAAFWGSYYVRIMQAVIAVLIAAIIVLGNSNKHPLIKLVEVCGVLVISWLLSNVLWRKKNVAMQHTERLLLIVFLVSRVFLLWTQYGKPIGFDNGGHIEMLFLLSWRHPYIELTRSFYSYHPPAAFLLARTVWFLIQEPVRSVQIVSFISSIASFFFIRGTLRRLGLLFFPSAIGFLYILFALPISIYLAHSINNDVLVFASMTAVLYFSIRLFWQQKERPSFRNVFLLNIALFIGIMSKFTGALIFGVPALVASLAPMRKQRLQRICFAVCACLVAFILAYTYYFDRYYKTTGNFFPVESGGGANVPCIIDRRAVRDANPIGYMINVFKAPAVHMTIGPEARDLEIPRLNDAWKDIWVSDLWIGKQVGLAYWLSTTYFTLAPFAVVIGAICFFATRKRSRSWTCFGYVMLGISIIEVAAMAAGLFKYPCGYTLPSKGIYIAPVILGLSYLLGQCFNIGSCLQLSQKWIRRLDMILLRVALPLFLALNTVLPIY